MKYKKAKKFDKEGRFARLGIIEFARDYINEEATMGTYRSIIDNFLENYNAEPDDMWALNEYLDNCCIVKEEDYLKYFGDIFNYEDSATDLCDSLAVWNIGEFFESEGCIYSCKFNPEKLETRKRINITGILMECERIYEMQKWVEIKNEDIEDMLMIINEYGNDIFGDAENYNYDWSEVVERIDQVIGGVM